MSLRYCVIEDETYDLAHQMDDAEQHLALAGLVFPAEVRS